MLDKPLILLTASLVFATSAFASARIMSSDGLQPDRHRAGARAGIVNSTGAIVQGTGFSVSHDGTGEYTLDVPPGKFANCPAITVTGSGINGHAPIADVYNYIMCGNQGEVRAQIRIYARTNGALQDNAFHFVMNDT